MGTISHQGMMNEKEMAYDSEAVESWGLKVKQSPFPQREQLGKPYRAGGQSGKGGQ